VTQMSRRDRTPKTLVVVLRSMMDMEFVIEMKNDTEVILKGEYSLIFLGNVTL
jgi:hypothetical protein